jgi:hypothetical protein
MRPAPCGGDANQQGKASQKDSDPLEYLQSNPFVSSHGYHRGGFDARHSDERDVFKGRHGQTNGLTVKVYVPNGEALARLGVVWAMLIVHESKQSLIVGID